MKTMIDNYRNIPGHHCGSTAMRNLLYHYCDLELSEETVFGLGSGVDFILIEDERYDPRVLTFGRSITMERDVGLALGVDYREQADMDNEKAWADVRREVEQGRPTMLSGDIFFLDYRDFKVRFPAHRFVLVGFDDDAQLAYVADRIDVKPQPCSYSALARSRNPSSGISTFNLWGKFYGREVANSMKDACAHAVTVSARRMLGMDCSQSELVKAASNNPNLRITTGVAGLEAFATSLSSWAGREDVQWIASYASQCIEKFGNGGGNFRRLYAGFLEWAHCIVPELVNERMPALAKRSSERWTALSTLLHRASEDPNVSSTWEQSRDVVGEIAELETELFETMNARFVR